MKKLPIEERKVSVTVAMSQETLKRLDSLSESFNCSRSSIISEAIRAYFEDYQNLINGIAEIPEVSHD